MAVLLRCYTSVVPAFVFVNTILAWSNRYGPAPSVVGAARRGKWRDQEEVVTVHTWASWGVDLVSLGSSMRFVSKTMR